MFTNPLRLQGRIALITGSTSGIGLAIAERLAQDGAKIIVSSRNITNVNAAVKILSEKGYDVIGVPCHIGDKSQRENLIQEAEKLGGLDIFVQNAAVNPTAAIGPILDCPEDAWDKIFDINLKCNFLLTKQLLPLLKKSNCPRIVYIGSAAAFISYEPLGPYSVSKMALVCFSRMVSLQVGKYGITANCIAPGLIDTPFAGNLINDPILRQQINNMSAIKRLGKVEDVSGLVAFLASNESSYITGETFGITGGYYCRL